MNKNKTESQRVRKIVRARSKQCYLNAMRVIANGAMVTIMPCSVVCYTLTTASKACGAARPVQSDSIDGCANHEAPGIIRCDDRAEP
jgi:hypothetical protein